MIAAFFDFDGTLYCGHIWSDLARHHWTARRSRRWVAVYVARNMAPWPLYRLGMLSQTAYYSAWGQTMSWLVRGWPVDDAQVLFEKLTDEQILPNLRNDMLDRMHEHQAQGHLVVLVSGTWSPWLAIVAQRLDIPHSVGTPLEVKGGKYTGKIIPPLCQGPGKPEQLRTFLRERQLDVHWNESYAYGDSGPDLSLLSQVGQPVAVCPDRELLEQALARGWPVIGEQNP